MPGVSRTDVIHADFVDAVELLSDGTVGYLTVNVTSTTSGTHTVVVALASDGEGILFGKDHQVLPNDIVVLSGTSGADGTYFVASVLSDTSFTVTGAIVSSTGGTASFYYPAGSTKVGVDPTKQNLSSKNILESSLADIANHEMLDSEPVGVGVTYSNTRVGNLVTLETWINTATTLTIKTVAYTYSGNKTTTEVRKVFSAADGVTIIAQVTLTYTYSGNTVSGTTIVRNV